MKKIFITTGICGCLIAGIAYAAQPVFDSQALAKTTQVINEAKKHTDLLSEQSETLTGQLQSLGTGVTIAFPSLDADKLKNQITRGMQCLLPDLEGLMPNIEFDSLDIGDICQRGDLYKQTLTAPPEALEGKTPRQREIIRKNVRNRRQAVLEDTVLKALAAGDSGIEESQQLNADADALSKQADKAENMNERLGVLIKGQALQLRGIAQTNQLLAQQLKLQAAQIANHDLGTDSVAQNEGGQ